MPVQKVSAEGGPLHNSHEASHPDDRKSLIRVFSVRLRKRAVQDMNMNTDRQAHMRSWDHGHMNDNRAAGGRATGLPCLIDSVAAKCGLHCR